MGTVTAGQRFSRSWRFIGTILIPLILLPLIFIQDDAKLPNGEKSKVSAIDLCSFSFAC